MTPLVSVIIPVYNAGKTISKCLDSIIRQTNENWEIIAVDDGSNDNSLSILSDYANNDNRIHIISKNNGGVSSARNYALNTIKGRYVAFVDADDYIDNNFLTIPDDLYGCDIIEKSYVRLKNGNITYRNIPNHNTIEGNYNVLSYYANNYIGSLWNKLIKSDVIADSTFNESIKIGEDFIFFVSLLSRVNSYGFSSIGIYYYIVGTTSAMNSVRNDKKNRYLSNKLILDAMEQVCVSIEQKMLFKVILFKMVINYLFMNREMLSTESLNDIKIAITKYNSLPSNYITWKTKIKYCIIYIWFKFYLHEAKTFNNNSMLRGRKIS